MIVVIIMVVLFMMPAGEPSVDDNLRSGQAQHDSTAVVAPKPNTNSNNNNNNNNNNYADNSNSNNDEEDDDDEINAEEIGTEIDTAREDIEDAVRQDLEKNKSALNAVIQVTGDYVRAAFLKLLGNTDITDAEIDEMVEQVENKLEEETIGQLENDAEEIAITLEEKIEDEAYDESGLGLDVEAIRSDIMANEEFGIRDMNRQIDEKAEKMKQMMREKAQELEIEILEKRLEEKLHKKVRLVVYDEELTDVDHILDGLSTLNGDGDNGGGSSSASGSVIAGNDSSNNDDGGSSTNDDDNTGSTDDNTGTTDDAV